MRSPVSLFTRISDDCAELGTLLARLEEEIPEKKRRPYGGFGSGQGGHPPLAAWNAPAAMLVMDVHHGLRDLETDLRYQVSGRVRTRGGSAGNTARCLERIPQLVSGLDYAAAQVTSKKLASWIYRSRLILGDADPVSRLPRLPGEGEPACPFCRSPGSLRVRHATGVVMCIRPTCRASGRVAPGGYSSQPLIAWPDGTTGVSTPAALC